MKSQSFSTQLASWLADKKPKTLQNLVDHFGEKSFAVIFLVLMAVPALPIPTGGVTHVFEIVCMLLALEMIAGFITVWLPKKWGAKNLPKSMQTTALPKFVSLLKKVERFSRVRFSATLKHDLARRITGLIVLVLCLFSFFAPPFTGLDTLPALGIVAISLGMILEDIVLAIAGTIIGAIGAFLVIGLGSTVIKLLFH